MDDEQWDKNVLDSLTEEVEPVTGDEEEGEEEFNVPPPVPNYRAIKRLFDLWRILKSFWKTVGVLNRHQLPHLYWLKWQPGIRLP